MARRAFLAGSSSLVLGSSNLESQQNEMHVLSDPQTYTSLVYQPPITAEKLPLIIFLHGAGKNSDDISSLANIEGQYGGLLPSLIANHKAPDQLLQNFVVVAPYAQGRRSFYDEPRTKVLNFISYAIQKLSDRVDPSRVYLFGFSDGATLAVELLTTRRFAGGVICSYGYTGILPDLALKRLQSVPMWVFHSADDAIFNVQNSDSLVQSLRAIQNNNVAPPPPPPTTTTTTGRTMVKYSRFEQDPEDFNGPARGHTTGITASRDPKVYEWLLSLSPIDTVSSAVQQ